VNEPVEPLIDSHNALLSTLLDQTHECIKLLDRDGRILFVNREGARALESSVPDALVGQIWVERWPETVRPEVAKALRAAQHGTVARFTAARPGPDGTQRWWDVTVTPVDADTGTSPRVLTIARDITAETCDRQRVAAITAEMRHRLKNAMTIATGIVSMTARSHPGCQDFAREVSQRFAQLAAVQELVLDPTRDKRFADILPLLTGAYGDASLLLFGELPEVRLSETAMQALALAFGELATNSLKYGALKHGRPIEITGTAGDGIFRMTWREPTTFGAPRDGAQGLGLIDRLVGASGGSCEREVGDDHLLVRLSLPTLA
jgi:PAS domain S-box-containing protein